MKVIVKEDIVIKDYTDQVLKLMMNKLVFANPEYYKKQNRGLWTGNTPENIVLMERNGNDLIVPFGMLPVIFKRRDIFKDIENRLKMPQKRLEYNSRIQPYEYQEKAITEALKQRQGVIVAPCGSGKTQIGLEIAARIGGKTLWLTHTADLLNQSMERAKSVFDIGDRDFGTITNGEIDIGNVITFATVQTMSKLALKDFRDIFDVVIVDEAHHIVGTPTRMQMFYHVISSLNARYKFGLTATPKRSDGLTKCMFALLGEKIYEIDRSEVEQTTCTVNVVIRETDFSPDMSKILMPDGTLSFAKLLAEICKDEDRNNLIVNDVKHAGGTCLILTDRVAHAVKLQEMLTERGIPCVNCLGQTKSWERERAIEALKNKQTKAMVATFALAKEGLDVPSLDFVFLATPQKNDTVVMQSAGRVGRRSLGKDTGIVVDYQDDFPMLKKWQKHRITIYKRNGYTIMD